MLSNNLVIVHMRFTWKKPKFELRGSLHEANVEKHSNNMNGDGCLNTSNSWN